MAFDANQYKNQFNKDTYANFKIRVPKSKKQVIDNLAQSTGKSINRLFIEAVEKVYHIDLTIVESELMQSE